MQMLSKEQLSTMFHSIKNTLKEMVDNGGRDTEKDIFSEPGKYVTKLSKNTVGTTCHLCGSTIKKVVSWEVASTTVKDAKPSNTAGL